MKEYKTVKLNLKPEHMRKLAGGKVIQLKSEMVGTGVSVTIGPVQHRKLMKALHANKGYRLRLSEDEKHHTMQHGGRLGEYFHKKRVRKEHGEHHHMKHHHEKHGGHGEHHHIEHHHTKHGGHHVQHGGHVVKHGEHHHTEHHHTKHGGHHEKHGGHVVKHGEHHHTEHHHTKHGGHHVQHHHEKHGGHVVKHGEHHHTKYRGHHTKKALEHIGAFGLKSKAKPKKGGDIKSVGKQIKKGFQNAVNTYKNNIRPVAGPIIRDALTKAVQVGAPALVTSLGAPELAPVAGLLANKYARQGVDYVGNQTGAFGLHGRGANAHYEDFDLRPKSYTVEANRSLFLSKHHPAMRPLPPMADFSRPRHQEDMHGSRFIEDHYNRNHSLVNYFIDHYHPPLNRIYGRGADKGSPMNPLLPHKDNSLRELYYDDIRRGRSFKTAGGSFMP